MQLSTAGRTDHVAPRYRRLLGRRNGVLKELTVDLGTTDTPDVVSTTASTCEVAQLISHGIGHEISVGGSHETSVRTAFDATVGEVTERYCLRFPDEDLVAGSHEEMRSRGEVVAFEYLDIYDREALATHYESFDRETTLQWTTGVNLLTGEELYVPAEKVWFNSGVLDVPDFHFPTTTTGVSAGPSVQFALLRSLYEVVERDGIIPVWYRQDAPPGVDVDSLADRWPALREYVAEDLEHEHLRFRLFECETTVDVPTVGGIAYSRGGRFPAFVHGANTRLSPRAALRGAATEAAQGYTFLHQVLLETDLADLDPSAHDNFKSNTTHYALPRNFEEVSFYVDAPTVPVEDVYPPGAYPDAEEWSLQAELEAVLERFAAAGVTPIAVDLTTRDVLRAGIRVVRVVAPELVPITPHPVPPTNHPRFAGEETTDKPHCIP